MNVKCKLCLDCVSTQLVLLYLWYLTPTWRFSLAPQAGLFLSLVGPPYKELEAESHRLSFGLGLCSVLFSSWCPSCLETGFLPYSSVITSLLGIPVSFHRQRTHLEFLVRLLVRPLGSYLPTCLPPGSCFHFQLLAFEWSPSPTPALSCCKLIFPLQICC